MDPFRPYYHPDSENENLKYEEDEADSYVALSTKSKRRKTTLAKPVARKIETRSAKRQSVKESSPAPKQEAQECSNLRRGRPKSLPSQAPTAMLPPKTPTSVRRKEIPSSQSPADTPFLTQSRGSIKEYARSPLKDLSTNIVSNISSRKAVRFSRGLEIADSIETEDDESPIHTPTNAATEPNLQTCGPAETAQNASQPPAMKLAVQEGDVEIPSAKLQPPPSEINDMNRGEIRREILDSETEDDDEGDGDFIAGPETQAVLIPSSSPTIPEQQLDSAFPPLNIPPRRITKSAISSQSLDSSHSLPQLPTRINSADQNPVQIPGQVDVINLVSSDPADTKDQTTAPTTHNQRSDSYEASAQLFNELHRGGLQTESQYESGWNSYLPSNILDAEEAENANLPSSSPHIEHPSSQFMTFPAQLLLTAKRPTCKVPTPPSQATTVDVTQPSPRRVFSSSQAVQTSPPPVPPPSSSPLGSWKAVIDPWAGYEWNGVRLTDSQLLPQSLLNDSLAEPPGFGFSQESLGQE